MLAFFLIIQSLTYAAISATVPPHITTGNSNQRPTTTAALDTMATTKVQIAPCVLADCQNPQRPINRKMTSIGMNHGSMPMVAIPKDASTPPAATAQTAHLAIGTNAARALLNTASDLRNAFMPVAPTPLPLTFPHPVLCLHNSP